MSSPVTTVEEESSVPLILKHHHHHHKSRRQRQPSDFRGGTTRRGYNSGTQEEEVVSTSTTTAGGGGSLDDDRDEDDQEDNDDSRGGGDEAESSSSETKSSSVIGGMNNFKQGKEEVRPSNHNVTYDPTHRWWEPPLGAWFPETNREILYLLWLYNAAVVLLARFTNLCGSPADVDDAQFCSEDFMLHEDMDLRGFSLGLFLLLSFRANQAYDRFWEGRKVWGR